MNGFIIVIMSYSILKLDSGYTLIDLTFLFILDS
jgi:hypothetical protein